MSFGIWQRTITDDAGNVLPGASIEVRAPSSNFTGALVSLFSDESGTTGLANPFTADSEGFAQFYAAPRKVDIRATGSGSQRTWRNVEILGTAATADKQTGPTDTTADALMAVGAFGVGSRFQPPEVDLSQLNDGSVATGIYQAADNIIQTTPWGVGRTILEVLKHENSSRHRINAYLITPSTNSRTATKSFSGDFSSEPWVEFYTTGNILGTVSQSGGVPTGAIIERGSDSNGEYMKFADGTLIMRTIVEVDIGSLTFKSFLTPINSTSPVAGGFSLGDEGSLSLESEFLSTLFVRCRPSEWTIFLHTRKSSELMIPITLFMWGTWY